MVQSAADVLGLGESMRQVLRNAKRQLIVAAPVKMDGGEVRVFEGYRVQHNIARGPAEGGGVCDPRSMSCGELERPTRRYGFEIAHRTDMRTGAYVLAAGRVAEAARVRGIFP